MQKLALIDYGAGNLRSVRRALQACGPDVQMCDGANIDALLSADRIILPGVGHFATCMERLTAIDGLIEALSEAVLSRGVPFLGICVGMQLLASSSAEDGLTSGLGWIDGKVEPLTPSDRRLPVPHMGWNAVQTRPHALFAGLGDTPHMYFAHAYAMQTMAWDCVMARCQYGGEIVAAIGRDNLFATQFHPEKSQRAGLLLFANFLNWQP